MKQKISITIDQALSEAIEDVLKDTKGTFRNRSHVLEYSLKKFLGEHKDANRI